LQAHQQAHGRERDRRGDPRVPGPRCQRRPAHQARRGDGWEGGIIELRRDLQGPGPGGQGDDEETVSGGPMRHLRLRCLGMAAFVLVAATARCGYPDFQFSTTCNLLQSDADCGAGQRCTIVDLTTGKTGCVPEATSPVNPYAACSSDSQCPASTWCDGRTSVC